MIPLALIALCVFLLLLVPVVLFLLTATYRQACVLCGLRKPSLMQATGVMFVTWLPVVVAVAVMRLIVHRACAAAGVPPWEAGLIVFFLAFPIDLVICSVLEAELMGIAVGKGIEIWFVQRLIQLGIVLAIALVAVLIILANG